MTVNCRTHDIGEARRLSRHGKFRASLTVDHVRPNCLGSGSRYVSSPSRHVRTSSRLVILMSCISPKLQSSTFINSFPKQTRHVHINFAHIASPHVPPENKYRGIPIGKIARKLSQTHTRVVVKHHPRHMGLITRHEKEIKLSRLRNWAFLRSRVARVTSDVSYIHQVRRYEPSR